MIAVVSEFRTLTNKFQRSLSVLAILSLPISLSIPLIEFSPVQAVGYNLPAIQNQTQDHSNRPLANLDDETDYRTTELTELTASDYHNDSANTQSNDNNHSDNNRNRSTNNPQEYPRSNSQRNPNSNDSDSRSSNTTASDSAQQPQSSSSNSTDSGLFTVLSSSFQQTENNQLSADSDFDNTNGPGSSTAGGEIVAISDIGSTEGVNNSDGETLQAADEVVNNSNGLPFWWWFLILAAVLGGLWLVVVGCGSSRQ